MGRPTPDFDVMFKGMDFKKAMINILEKSEKVKNLICN